MTMQADRLILIGLDGLGAEMLEKFMAEGELPQMSALTADGVFTKALSAPPLDTPTNWAGISTGAWPGTHGIASFGIQLPGRDLGDPLLGAFNTNLCRAEFLWDVAERVGKTPFVFDYPVSWPPTVHKGIVARPTTAGRLHTVWDSDFLWKGMGSFGWEDQPLKAHASLDKYVWDQIYEVAELSAYPEDVQGMIEQELGPYPRRPAEGDRAEDFLYHAGQYANYFADMAELLQRKQGWDLLMMHIHTIDSLHHTLQNAIWPEHPDYDPDEAATVWDIYRRSMRILDEMVGRVAEECGNEQTIVAVVSDHGAVPCYKAFWINSALQGAGLLAYRDAPGPDGSWVDWEHTQAIGSYTATEHIWVNLAGRHPQGIVAPGREYERVRERILQTLYDSRDPETGDSPVSVALRIEDAAPLGQWGGRCSDVLVCAKPEYYVADFNHYHRVPGETFEAAVRHLASLGDRVVERYHKREDGDWLFSWRAGGYHHGHLPTAELGDLTNRPFLLMAGPGIRQGYRREQAINLVDVAPTLAQALGWPAPAQAEGAVRFDLLT